MNLRASRHLAGLSLALLLARCGEGAAPRDAALQRDNGPVDASPFDANEGPDATVVDESAPRDDGAPHDEAPGETQPSDVTTDETSAPADVIAEDTRVDPRCAPDRDSDGDGATNEAECRAGTDPLLPDSDMDGLSDGVELAYPRVCVATASAMQRRPVVSCTGDMGCTPGERCAGLDAREADSDGDGVNDGTEDLNGDGRIELARGETDPRVGDTDGDGTVDGMSGVAICRPSGLATVVQTALPVGPTQVGFAPSWGTARRIRGTMNRGALALDDATVSVSALIASVPSTGDLRAEAMRLEALVSAALGANTTPVLLGRTFTTHEGQPAVLSTFRVARSASASALRDAVVMPLVGAAAMPPPRAVGNGSEFLVDLTVVRRTMGRSANTDDVVVTVAPRALLEDRAEPTALRATDLSNATAIAENDRGLGYHCQTFRAGAAPQVDFIVPTDVSPSMDRYQQAIGQTAQRFFTDMTSAGVDFRVAVLQAQPRAFDFRSPGLSWTLGTAADGAREMAFRVTVARYGGDSTDRLAPYPNDGTFTNQANEEPLAAGVLAVQQLSSTSVPAAARLRSGALVALFFIADETGTNDDSRYFALDTTSWGATYPARLRSATEFFSSRHALTFGMVNDAMSNCAMPPATAQDFRRCLILNNGGAYIPIATATDADVAAAMARIVAAVAGAASPYRLERRPITSTLKVRVRNRDVPRSRTDGFDYDAVSNAVVFYGSTHRPARGDEVAISYRLWQPCPGLGGSCTADGECCAPEMCRSNRCAPACVAAGATCTTNGECCSPNVCVDGRCGAPVACRMEGAMCTTTADCCLPNVCEGGRCRVPLTCRPTGAMCAANGDCCAPNVCEGGRCAPFVCRPIDGACMAPGDCCSGVCTMGRCDRAPCRAESLSCTSAADCCSGSCIEGRCGPG